MNRRQYLTLAGTVLTGTGVSGCVLSDSGPEGSVIGKLGIMNVQNRPREVTVILINNNGDRIYERTVTIGWEPGNIYEYKRLSDLPSTPVVTVRATMGNQTMTEPIPADREPQSIDIQCSPQGKLGIARWGTCDDC
jgi:hypothetical protein